MRLKVAMLRRRAATSAFPGLHSTVGATCIWSAVRKDSRVPGRSLDSGRHGTSLAVQLHGTKNYSPEQKASIRSSPYQASNDMR